MCGLTNGAIKLATLSFHGGKLWARRGSGQHLDRPAGSEGRRVAGWKVNGEEVGGKGTPTSNNLGDYTGRHFVEGVPFQVRDRQGAIGARGGGGMTDPHPWREFGVWIRPWVFRVDGR